MEFKVRIDVLKDEAEKLIKDMQAANLDVEVLIRAHRDLNDAFLQLRTLAK